MHAVTKLGYKTVTVMSLLDHYGNDYKYGTIVNSGGPRNYEFLEGVPKVLQKKSTVFFCTTCMS